MPRRTQNAVATPVLRLLIIDDSDMRIDTFKQWLPDDVQPVFATTAGRAL